MGPHVRERQRLFASSPHRLVASSLLVDEALRRDMNQHPEERPQQQQQQQQQQGHAEEVEIIEVEVRTWNLLVGNCAEIK